MTFDEWFSANGGTTMHERLAAKAAWNAALEAAAEVADDPDHREGGAGLRILELLAK